ncbi:lipase (class 3) domain-containing protein [Hirsutella rhossiliensis]|uniref:Lipase (Class 3) domain-containing protein n=1 Tax=Hirsutella rhossiliensis TaxID=111463 RepID=A0A9P8MV86_9HYPO|nr:lipase (class 3) domain-containing protein [Hirsutella rhossiliensis]KAH0961049.1 lipase (class 3) domain-containing protein [Hirsutella rhossiliensis]
MTEHSAAAYCNSKKEPGQMVECDGNCPTVKENRVILNHTFSGWPGALNGYIAVDHERKEIVLSIRGSWSLPNWVYDVRFFFTDCEYVPGCRVHTGFAKAWGGVSDKVTAILQSLHREHKYPVVVTGHSLGGAAATIAAAHLRYRGLPVEAYTYGAPRAGNIPFANFASSRLNGTTYRVTHDADTIALVPPIFMGYAHTSPEFWISAGSKETKYGKSQIFNCTGIKNHDCQLSTSGLGLPAHFHYFRKIDACKPTLPLRRREETFDIPDGWKDNINKDRAMAKQDAVFRRLQSNDCAEILDEEILVDNESTYERAVVRKCSDSVEVNELPERTSIESATDLDSTREEPQLDVSRPDTSSNRPHEMPQPVGKPIWAERDGDKNFKQCKRVFPDNACVRELFYLQGSSDEIRKSCRDGNLRKKEYLNVGVGFYRNDVFPKGPKCGEFGNYLDGVLAMKLTRKDHYGPICEQCVLLDESMWAERDGNMEFQRCREKLSNSPCVREFFHLQGSVEEFRKSCQSGNLAKDERIILTIDIFPEKIFPGGPQCGKREDQLVNFQIEKTWGLSASSASHELNS